MIDSKFRFRDGLMNVHDEDRNGHLKVMTDGLVKQANITTCKNW